MKSAVDRAIEILGGRLEDAAVVARVSAPSVWHWVRKGRISRALHAVLIAEACAAAGHPEITVARLAGMNGKVADGRRPDPHD